MHSNSDGRAECQRLLAQFRVLELKELLRNMGQSQKGRKPELFQRANEVLRHGSPKIQIKIREIFDKSHNVKKPAHYNRIAQRYTPMKPTSHHMNLASPVRAHSYIVHPDVKFKEQPFFVKMDTIIRPTALVSTHMTSNGAYTMRVEFHLTPQQVQQIYLSKTSQGTYEIQVLLRFCRQETSCEQDDFYPKHCYIRVNNQYCPLQGYYPNVSQKSEMKRTGAPINITNYVKTSPTQTNDVTVFWSHDIVYPQGFCISIELAKSLSATDLLTKLKLKGARSPDVSRALVREKFVVDKDSEIAATSLRVSLLCPLGKLRMTHPCRSAKCSHLQCFDASIYLQMNEKKARWVCPVCDQPAPLEELVIDGLFKEICENSPVNDIVFSSDGSWHPLKDTKGAPHYLSTSSKHPRGSSPVTISDSTPTARGGAGGDDERGKSSCNPIVIDLTESSDEEEDDRDRGCDQNDDDDGAKRDDREESSISSPVSGPTSPCESLTISVPIQAPPPGTIPVVMATPVATQTYNPRTTVLTPQPSISFASASSSSFSSVSTVAQPVPVITQGFPPLTTSNLFPSPFSGLDDTSYLSAFPLDESLFNMLLPQGSGNSNIISLD